METEEVKELPVSGRTEIKSRYRRPRHSFMWVFWILLLCKASAKRCLWIRHQSKISPGWQPWAYLKSPHPISSFLFLSSFSSHHCSLSSSSVCISVCRLSLWLEHKVPKGGGFALFPAVIPAPGAASATSQLLNKYEWTTECEETRLEKAGKNCKTRKRKGWDVKRARRKDTGGQRPGVPTWGWVVCQEAADAQRAYRRWRSPLALWCGRQHKPFYQISQTSFHIPCNRVFFCFFFFFQGVLCPPLLLIAEDRPPGKSIWPNLGDPEKHVYPSGIESHQWNDTKPGSILQPGFLYSSLSPWGSTEDHKRLVTEMTLIINGAVSRWT